MDDFIMRGAILRGHSGRVYVLPYSIGTPYPQDEESLMKWAVIVLAGRKVIKSRWQ